MTQGIYHRPVLVDIVRRLHRSAEQMSAKLRSLKSLALVLFGCVALAGCASTDRSYGMASDIQVADLSELPPGNIAEPYVIGPQELVEISVVGAEALSGKFLTDNEGNLTYPLLGTIDIAGLDPAAASRVIADGLRGDYLVNPQVRLIPEELPQASVSVGGQVERPGTYAATGTMSLLRAVNLAGGLGEYAKHDDVLIMRTVDGQSYIGLYNIAAIERGNYPDPQIYPNDIVMVGDSPGRRRLDSILAIATPLLSTSAVILNVLTR